jgi:hypothetical protein
LNCLQGGLPIFSGGLWNVLEDDPSTSHVLVLDQLFGVAVLLFRQLVEEVGEAVKGDVVTIEVGGLES